MKYNNKKILGLIAVLALIFSCEKDLDLAPLDQVSDASFWKVPGDFEKAATAFYGSLANHSGGGKDQNSDITVGPSSNGTSNGSLILDNGPEWSGSYKIIRGTTKLIENYEKAVDIQPEISRYAAEARFFRARAYQDLISTFGDVPLITSVLEIDSEELDAPRAPRADVVAYILEDLDWSIDKLPLQSELTDDEDGRITKGAVLALKSRMFLFEGTWAKYHGVGDADAYLTISIDASNKLIASGEYEIYKGISKNTVYRHLFLEEGEGSKESILARRYNEELEISHRTTRDVGTFHNSPTKKLADMYLCTDGLPISISPLFKGYDTKISEFEGRDPRMPQTFIIPGSGVNQLGEPLDIPSIGSGNKNSKSGYLPYKFYSDNKVSQEGKGYYDYMEFRYAEVLLNHAEALYEKNGIISDSDLDITINMIRSRVEIANLTNTFVTSNNLNMLEEIRRERTIELAYEGFRYNDLRRWKLAEVLLPVHLRGVKYTGTEFESTPPNNTKTIPVDSNGFVIADDASRRSWDQKLYLFPIPVVQIKLNPNLTQNPGW